MSMPYRTRWLLVALGTTALVVSTIAFPRVQDRTSAAGLSLIGLMVASGLFTHAMVRHHIMVPGDPVHHVRWRVQAFAAGAVAGAALVGAWRLVAGAPDGLGFAGVVTLAMFSSLALGEGRRSEWACRSIGTGAAVAAAALLAVGLVTLPVAPAWLRVLAIGGGALALPVSISLKSAALNRYLRDAPLSLAVGNLVVSSLLLIGSATVIAETAGVNDQYVRLATLLVTLLVLATAARSNGEAVLAIAAAALLIAATPTPVEAPDLPAADSFVAVLGDSFMSGEGAPSYFENTNEQDVNTC